MLAFAALLLLQPPVEGLAPGETIREIAPATTTPDAALQHGRVVDALSGRPISGATIETWTEEIDRVFGGFHRVGEAVSGLDGRFAVPVKDADKVRVRAPGYATLSAVPSDFADALELFPAPAEPVRLRVVDSSDRPIAGARITTTYSCAHDVPAFDVRTDATGEALLPAFGLQDAIPRLRVRAAGYRAIKYLDPADLLAAREPWVVRLARLRGASAELLDEAGAPVTDTTVVVRDGDGEHVVRTDAAGRFNVPSLFAPGEVQIAKLGQHAAPPAFLLGDWSDATVRLDGFEWPASQPVGEIKVVAVPAPAAGDELPNVRVLHDRGFGDAFPWGEAFRFPAGHVRLAFGGPFSGWAAAAAAVDVAAGERTKVELAVQREPRVRLHLPQGTVETWIEAGDDSVSGLAAGAPVPVPAGTPLVFYARTATEQHQERCAAAEDGMVVDLTGEATLIHPARTNRLGSMTVTVAGDRTGEIRVLSPRHDFAVQRLEQPRRWRIEGPVGVRFFARYRADGCAETGFAGVLESGAEPVRTMAAVPLASLAIESDVPCEPVGTDELDLAALHPGPLRLVIELAGGRRLGLALDLAPGAARTLRVH